MKVDLEKETEWDLTSLIAPIGRKRESLQRRQMGDELGALIEVTETCTTLGGEE